MTVRDLRWIRRDSCCFTSHDEYRGVKSLKEEGSWTSLRLWRCFASHLRRLFSYVLIRTEETWWRRGDTFNSLLFQALKTTRTYTECTVAVYTFAEHEWDSWFETWGWVRKCIHCNVSSTDYFKFVSSKLKNLAAFEIYNIDIWILLNVSVITI